MKGKNRIPFRKRESLLAKMEQSEQKKKANKIKKTAAEKMYKNFKD